MLLLHVKAFYSFIVFFLQRMFFFSVCIIMKMAVFSRRETPATARSPQMKSLECDSEEEAVHVYCPSLRFWAEPVDATEKEQKLHGD